MSPIGLWSMDRFRLPPVRDRVLPTGAGGGGGANSRGDDASDRRSTAPPSGAFQAVTVPPCDSATCRTIASPSPEPGRPRAAALR